MPKLTSSKQKFKKVRFLGKKYSVPKKHVVIALDKNGNVVSYPSSNIYPNDFFEEWLPDKVREAQDSFIAGKVKSEKLTNKWATSIQAI
jgi:hypothetical protein